MFKNRLFGAVISLSLAMALPLSGCGGDRRDTREYVSTIGVVVTIAVDSTVQELYVYPGSIQDMGQDFIKNTRQLTKVGSFGVTVEAAESYKFWLKDRDGGTYEFERVPLENADHAVITMDGELVLTVHHQSGGTETVLGEYVRPGDAPDHSQVDLKETQSYAFKLHNETGHSIGKVTMREAARPEAGEVELYLKTIRDGERTSISGALAEDDFEVREWVLYVENEGGEGWLSQTNFDPWTAKSVTISLQNGQLMVNVEQK